MSDGVHQCDSPGAIMSAIADSDCRDILVATAEEPRTVSELVEACEIPMATAYRKVERLTGLDLLEEQIRVKPRGRNSREYRLSAEAIHVQIPERQDPAVAVSCTIGQTDSPKGPIRRISTDGGRSASESIETGPEKLDTVAVPGGGVIERTDATEESDADPAEE